MKPSQFESEIFRSVTHKEFQLDGTTYQLSKYPYLDIVLTDHCNSKCKFCIADLLHYRINCNPDVFKEQIKWSVDVLGVKEVLLLGGEPTVSNSLFDMIEFCKGLDLNKICITTNGKRCQQDSEYAYQLMGSGITHMNVSIMNFNEEAQSFVHGTRNNLNKDGLRRLYAVANMFDVHLRVNTNVYKGNHDTVTSMIDFYNEVSHLCDSIKYSPLLRTDAFSVVPEVNDFNRDYILSPDEYEALFNGLINGNSHLPLVVNKHTFGFVEYRMLVTDTPIILNYNHRGEMLKRAVEFKEINNIKLLPNGNLSRSWNRESLDHVIRFSTVE